MGQVYHTKYTPEQRERIKAMWLEGCSSRFIAGHFEGVTRSAIIGLISRMGLPRRETVKSVKSAERKPKVVAPVVILDEPVPCGESGDPGPGFIECGHARKMGSLYCQFHYDRSIDRSRKTNAAGMNPKTGAARVFR